jgi:hypothetical protein
LAKIYGTAAFAVNAAYGGALDCTRINVQIKNAADTANQAKNEKQNKKKRKFFFFFNLIRNRDKIKINCKKNKILIITSRKIKSI